MSDFRSYPPWFQVLKAFAVVHAREVPSAHRCRGQSAECKDVNPATTEFARRASRYRTWF